jgi:hypothetical protein
MSPAYTFIAPGALIVALILLFLSNRAEAHETMPAGNRRPLPGKFFIVILPACTFPGMAITESQGVCRLPPRGFITGIFLALQQGSLAYFHSGKKTKASPIGSGNPLAGEYPVCTILFLKWYEAEIK